MSEERIVEAAIAEFEKRSENALHQWANVPEDAVHRTIRKASWGVAEYVYRDAANYLREQLGGGSGAGQGSGKRDGRSGASAPASAASTSSQGGDVSPDLDTCDHPTPNIGPGGTRRCLDCGATLPPEITASAPEDSEAWPEEAWVLRKGSRPGGPWQAHVPKPFPEENESIRRYVPAEQVGDEVSVTWTKADRLVEIFGSWWENVELAITDEDAELRAALSEGER